ncbi:MAG: hypothetical protein FJ403_01580 [Verrucomicrobia bacterium]|nr:hypothetical protein [Verrucomicrobiota bacterium]
MLLLNCCLSLLVLSSCALANAAEMATLPNTQPLTWNEDLSAKMLAGLHQFAERKIDQSIEARQKHWKRDFSSREAYEKSVAPNRERFRKAIGLVDPRANVAMQRWGDDNSPALVAETDNYRVFQVRWPVLEDVSGEGLLLEPKPKAAAFVIALPDADQTPEMIAGLADGIPADSQFARGLAENGFEVIVPMLRNRADDFSGNPEIFMTPQPHREWIYRQAFQMGRHIIGYEAQKVLAAVDWIKARQGAEAKVGVAGYAEGGLIAFYAAAADTRIDACFVSGYFDSRQRVWTEPIYRNVWGLLHEFGDAEIATLIAPGGLVVEYSDVPKVDGPPPPRSGKRGAGAGGKLTTPAFASVESEFKRIDTLLTADFQPKRLVSSQSGTFGSALKEFSGLLGLNSAMSMSNNRPIERRTSVDARDRQQRQVKELENHVQSLVRNADLVRDQFFLNQAMPELRIRTWNMRLRHPTHAPEKFVEAALKYRAHLWEEVLGKVNDPLLPPNSRSRKIYDREKWVGYEVVLDVLPDVFAWGVLLVPKDVKAGEKRPLVVCQHGRNGLPQDVIEGNKEAYNDFAARLAERGFITFAPHNLYRIEERYRWLGRKANGVKLSMFSFIIAQHDQMLRWLETLPITPKWPI